MPEPQCVRRVTGLTLTLLLYIVGNKIENNLGCGSPRTILVEHSPMFKEGDILCSKYKLKKRFDEGGFSSVWLAEDLETQENLALKIYESIEVETLVNTNGTCNCPDGM